MRIRLQRWDGYWSYSAISRPLSALLLAGLAALAFQACARADTALFLPKVSVELCRYFAHSSSISISADQPFTVRDNTGTLIGTVAAGKAYALTPALFSASAPVGRADSEESEEGDEAPTTAEPGGAHAPVVLEPDNPEAIFTIARPGGATRRYRGVITASPDGTALRLVDTLPLEDYVAGVLDAEIGASAPLEARRAQAVAARTYAVFYRGKLSAEGADVDDTTRCQGYLGVDGESERSRDAAKATYNEVLTWHGSVIDAEYSTDCGGKTAPGPADEPYLQTVTDTSCAAETPWRVSCAPEMLGKAFFGDETPQPTPETVAVDSTDSSDRAVSVTATLSDGTHRTLPAAKLRQLLGFDRLKSTRFTVEKTSDGQFVFTGEGWGHGEGMCQRGAIALAASAGFTYDRILKHYYTGVDITTLTPAMLVSSRTSVIARR